MINDSVQTYKKMFKIDLKKLIMRLNLMELNCQS